MSPEEPDSAPALSDEQEPASGEAGQVEADPGARYERQGLLGVGGMGRVYAAQDLKLRRQVALKLAATPELSGRLAREAWITAQLEHPGIVAVYDAGESKGQGWYTMRLIRGRTLRERLRDCAGLEQRLGLLPHMLAAAQAVAYAHSMGIVHRDLKPSNIMVGEFGETQVADWGLARPVDDAVQDWQRIVAPSHQSGAAGTARYMSPEQARGASVGFASDVFCLGAALYEVLAGLAPPDEPGRPPDLEGLSTEVPAELIAVVRRCVQVDPSARYPTAVELAEDLERWLGGRRVLAHEYRPSELLFRLVDAWKAPLAVAALALLLVTAVVGVAVLRTAQERAAAESSLALALTEQALSALLTDRQPEAQVMAAHALGLEPSPEARGVIAATAGVEAFRRLRVELPEICQHTSRASPDSQQLACVGQGRLEVWRLAPLEQLWSLDLDGLGAPFWAQDRMAVPAGDRLLWLVDGEVVEQWEGTSWWFPSGDPGFVVDGGDALPLSGARRFPTCAAARPTITVAGEHLLVGCDDGVLRAYDERGRVVQELALSEARPPWSVLLPVQDELLIGRLDGSVQVLDRQTGVLGPPLEGFAGSVLAMSALPGTDLVVALGEGGGLRIWDHEAHVWVGSMPQGASRVSPGPGSGEVLLVGDSAELWQLPESPRPTVIQFAAGVAQVAISREADRIAVATGDGRIEERWVTDGRSNQWWWWSDAVAKSVAYGPKALVAAAMGAPGQLLTDQGHRSLDTSTGVLRRVGAMGDGRFWGLGYDKQAIVYDAQGKVLSSQLLDCFDGSTSPDGLRAAIVGSGGALYELLDQEWTPVGHLSDAIAVDIDDQGVLYVARRREVCRLPEDCVGLPDDVVDVSVGHGLVALGTLNGDVRLLDASTWETLAVLRGHTSRVSSVEFGPQGSWLVSGSWDQTVRFWDLSDLFTDPQELIARAEGTWGLTLEDALSNR